MKSFEQIKSQLAGLSAKKRIGVVAAQDEHTLQAILAAANEGYVEPVLIGDQEKIQKTLAQIGADGERYEIRRAGDPESAAALAARMVRAEELDCLMKGQIETGVLMKALVNRESGIRLRGTMSQVTFLESPYYHKLFAVTDVALLPYPTLEQKAEIIRNAVDALRALGIKTPKVAVLAAIEHTNPKMKETLEADALKRMQENGEIRDCIVEGPISYDLAMDPESAAIKGYKSPVAGDADILVAPDLICANILFKSLVFTGGAKMAGTVMGARVPLVLTSRSSSTEDKYMSILLNALIGRAGNAS